MEWNKGESYSINLLFIRISGMLFHCIRLNWNKRADTMEKNKVPKIPELLPPKIDYNKIYKELCEANKAIGELQGMLTNIPSKRLLVDPLLTKEAVASSTIEGTQATLEDVYRYEADEKGIEKPEKKEDIREIINYREALKYAIEKIEKETQPIGENFIKNIHSVLLNSTRGERRDRGNLRRIQVYIGKPGEAIEEASYIPPPPTELPRLLSNWENYVNMNNDHDPLVIAAVSHYQFEAIHPFMDGNGRIGRILIPIILFQKRYLDYPYLYMSEYFEFMKDSYIKELHKMDESGVWEDWINSFLSSVRFQANATQIKAYKIFSLHLRIKEKIHSFKSAYAGKLMDIIFLRPVISFKLIKDILPVRSNQTVYNLLDKFQKEEILVQIGESSRNKQYVFRELMDIFASSLYKEIKSEFSLREFEKLDSETSSE